MIASDFISDTITCVKNDYSGEQVLTLMNVFQVKHLPVIDDNMALLGLISDDDILIRDYDNSIESYQLELKKVSVAPDQHIYDIIHLLSKHDISLIPVMDDDRYMGSIRKQDVISFMGDSFSFTYPGSIVELVIQNRNYSLAELSRIVEAENAKILSVFIAESDQDNNCMNVILKIDKQDITSIISAFERFEYEVKASYTDHNDYDDLLKERYDALMRYLNV
jgi:acetoin utilization protein AcuB